MAGGGHELKLLGTWTSPFALRVKLALDLKGLSYEDVEEDLRNKSDLLLSSNPVHEKVPVLIHNGKPICESQIIVQYIDETFVGTGPSLLPADPYERAIARFWAAYVDDKVDTTAGCVLFVFQLYRSASSISLLSCDGCLRALQLLASWLQSFRGKTEEEKAEGLKQTLVAVEHMEAAFKECSKGKPFFGGDSVSYLDVALGCLVAWVHAGEKLYGFRLLDATRSPLLNAWAERFGALDAAKAVLPDADRLVDYAKMKQAEAAAAATSNN
jgi:glutathione S-transferase